RQWDWRTGPPFFEAGRIVMLERSVESNSSFGNFSGTTGRLARTSPTSKVRLVRSEGQAATRDPPGFTRDSQSTLLTSAWGLMIPTGDYQLGWFTTTPTTC